jgi:hypothetical protein
MQARAAAELENVRGELAAAHEAMRDLEQAEARLEGEVQAAVKRAEDAEARSFGLSGLFADLEADAEVRLMTVGEKMALLDADVAALEKILYALGEQVRVWAHVDINIVT